MNMRENDGQSRDGGPQAPPAKGIPWAEVALAIGLSFMAALTCYLVAGATLGLFFGGMAMAVLLLPPLTLVARSTLHRLLLASAVCDGIAIVWIASLFDWTVSFMQLLQCYVLLAAWCGSLAGLTCALAEPITPDRPDESTTDVVPSAIVVLLGFIWLTCPIWLPASTGVRIDSIISFHPLFAINGVLTHLGLWTQQPIAYRYLFTLGQDVPYTLPTSILPSVTVHLVVGAIGLGACWLRGSR
jgi:hypothetical protein